MTASSPDLRGLVSSVVREMLAELVTDAVRTEVRGATASAPEPPPPPATPGATYVTPPDPRLRQESVRIDDDADLDQFVRHLLGLFENPKNRQDLRAGRLTFHLSRPPRAVSGAAVGPATRIDRGAVTERQVKAAAEAGHRLIVGRRAVITPLAREKARALDIPIEKER